MPWVNRDQYSPGKRHYYRGEVVTGEPKPTWRGPDWIEYTQTMDGPALCGHTVTATVHSRVDGKYANGKLSVVTKVNLMQRNLCSYCVAAYFREIRPDLRPAYLALKNGKIEVDG